MKPSPPKTIIMLDFLKDVMLTFLIRIDLIFKEDFGFIKY